MDTGTGYKIYQITQQRILCMFVTSFRQYKQKDEYLQLDQEK
jgi:putative component of toxin-antitoxin plasmid stabilization module